MTPPPARLIRLHLHSRDTRRAIILIAAAAAILRASQPLTSSTGVFSQVSLLLITAAPAAVIAAALETRSANPSARPAARCPPCAWPTSPR
jgi:hypothetical protein